MAVLLLQLQTKAQVYRFPQHAPYSLPTLTLRNTHERAERHRTCGRWNCNIRQLFAPCQKLYGQDLQGSMRQLQPVASEAKSINYVLPWLCFAHSHLQPSLSPQSHEAGVANKKYGQTPQTPLNTPLSCLLNPTIVGCPKTPSSTPGFEEPKE